ncbi:MAG: hypothetical protein QOI04_1322 [Verrucomicrobiota bacterium]|jgi:hypothetical protein
MKITSATFKIVALGTLGIGLAVSIVSFAQTAPAPGSYVLVLKDNVPIKDKGKLEAALKKNTKDKMKWKDESGTVTDIPAGVASNSPRAEDIRTTQVKVFDKAERERLTVIGVNVTQQVSFNTAAALKEVVDTLQ